MKWIIRVNIPSGDSWAFSGLEGKFALVPISKEGTVRKAYSFDTKENAEKYLAVLCQEDRARKFCELFKPEIIACEELQ